MDTLFAKVAGLDVHLKRIQCAVRCRQESGKLIRQACSFGTMTRDLRALADYLQQLGVTHVAMEATGVLWKPVWNILEGRFTLLLVNPRHLKKVPGRKTDVSDAEWIAQLLQCGLLRGSFQRRTLQPFVLQEPIAGVEDFLSIHRRREDPSNEQVGIERDGCEQLFESGRCPRFLGDGRRGRGWLFCLLRLGG